MLVERIAPFKTPSEQPRSSSGMASRMSLDSPPPEQLVSKLGLVVNTWNASGWVPFQPWSISVWRVMPNSIASSWLLKYAPR